MRLTEIFSQLDSAARDELGLFLCVFSKVIQDLLHIFLQPPHWEEIKKK